MGLYNTVRNCLGFTWSRLAWLRPGREKGNGERGEGEQLTASQPGVVPQPRTSASPSVHERASLKQRSTTRRGKHVRHESCSHRPGVGKSGGAGAETSASRDGGSAPNGR
jgi:RecB family exonuclease